MIQKEVYIHLLKKADELGLSETFLNEIHPFMREGLKEFLIFNKKKNTLKKILKK